MSFKQWVKKYAKEIAISVIVSLITTVVIKGVDLFKEIAPTAGRSVWVFFINTFYSSAAQISETSLITFIFSALIGGVFAYIFALATKTLGSTKNALEITEDILKDIDTHRDQKCETENEQPQITESELKNEARDIIKKAKSVRKRMILSIIFFAFYFGYIIIFNLFPHSLWTDYQKDLLKIAPYIERQELIKIKSDWVCMQSKEDYDEIYKRIDAIKNEFDLP